MSTDYTETLKKIKDTEEASSREVLARRKALEEEIRQMEDAAGVAIADARRKADAYVAEELEKTERAAQKEADSMLTSTEKESEQIASRKLDKAALRKLIDDLLLVEFK